MGEVVNLGKHRKAKEREARQKQAEANRVRYGRTKAERAREEAEAAQADKAHDLLKFERRDKAVPNVSPETEAQPDESHAPKPDPKGA